MQNPSVTSHDGRTRVAVFAGARSTEHEVSLASSYNIVNAIDTSKYEVFVVGIDKQGVWRQYDPASFVEHGGEFTEMRLAQPISGRLAVAQCSNEFYDIDNGGKVAFAADVIFPAVLGNYAEDGTMQGLLRMMDVPFTTPDVLGSAVGMDKDVAYRLLRDAGINVADFMMVRKTGPQVTYDEVASRLGTTVFVKPANTGSSVGVSKATNAEELASAIELAYRYDVKVLIQAAIIGREVEISVMGNFDGQQTSVIGEIIEKHEGDFYSYDNKYVHSDNVELIAPAQISDDVTRTIKATALKVCETLECEGFGRVDFFVDQNDKVYVNEINTMPGFTKISMFPRLWGESGVDYPTLVDKLLQYAIARHTYRIEPLVTDASDILTAAENA